MKNFFAGIGRAGILPLFFRESGEKIMGFEDHRDWRQAFLLRRCYLRTFSRLRIFSDCDRFAHTHTAASHLGNVLFLETQRINEGGLSFELFLSEVIRTLNPFTSYDALCHYGAEQILRETFFRFFDRTKVPIFFDVAHPVLKLLQDRNRRYPVEWLTKAFPGICLDGEKLLWPLPPEKEETTLLSADAGSICFLTDTHVQHTRERSFLTLCAEESLKLEENVPLAPKTTLRIGGFARFWAEPKSLTALCALLRNANRSGLPRFLLGNGSKLLVDDDGFSGLLIRLRGPFWENCSLEEDRLRVGAGLSLTSLADFCAAHGISSYEFCRGIPGTVGGAIRMNAGAFGSSIGTFVNQITYLDGAYELRETEQIPFLYRDWGMPTDSILVEASLRRPKKVSPTEEILQKQKSLARQRRERQPPFPSAGSVFRNPPGKVAAWELIAKAGLRGLRRGGAEVSPVHVNFIVNAGGACSGDVLDLIFRIQWEVRRHFAVDLVTELEYLSDRWAGRLG